jgi:hypothetical protein
MESAQAELLVFLLQVTAAVQALALVFVVTWNARASKRIGPRIHVIRRRMAWRYAFLAGVALIGLALLLVEVPVPAAKVPGAAVLALSAALLALQPGFADSRCGERGVQIGWHARGYEDLPEWRLTGDHLRWRLGEIWVACDLPVARHAELRTRLEELAPGRESRFSR